MLFIVTWITKVEFSAITINKISYYIEMIILVNLFQCIIFKPIFVKEFNNFIKRIDIRVSFYIIAFVNTMTYTQ